MPGQSISNLISTLSEKRLPIGSSLSSSFALLRRLLQQKFGQSTMLSSAGKLHVSNNPLRLRRPVEERSIEELDNASASRNGGKTAQGAGGSLGSYLKPFQN
jgi:hypothetical protein